MKLKFFAIIVIVLLLGSFAAGCAEQTPEATVVPTVPSFLLTRWSLLWYRLPKPFSRPQQQFVPLLRFQGSYQASYLNPLDYPHTYIEDTCQYLQMKWNPENSTPGTVVMVIMFHSVSKDDATAQMILRSAISGI